MSSWRAQGRLYLYHFYLKETSVFQMWHRVVWYVFGDFQWNLLPPLLTWMPGSTFLWNYHVYIPSVPTDCKLIHITASGQNLPLARFFGTVIGGRFVTLLLLLLLLLLWGIVSGCARCCQFHRVRTLNQVSAGGLHQGILKSVYEARNMVKWHD